VTTTEELGDRDRIVVYGRHACPDTQRARRHFDLLGVAYRYVDLDLDGEAGARVEASGYLATPVVVTPDGQVDIEPSDERLAALAGDRWSSDHARVT
jgi:glutaredoxin